MKVVAQNISGDAVILAGFGGSGVGIPSRGADAGDDAARRGW
jgi:hypothetical protein